GARICGKADRKVSGPIIEMNTPADLRQKAAQARGRAVKTGRTRASGYLLALAARLEEEAQRRERGATAGDKPTIDRSRIDPGPLVGAAAREHSGILIEPRPLACEPGATKYDVA